MHGAFLPETGGIIIILILLLMAIAAESSFSEVDHPSRDGLSGYSSSIDGADSSSPTPSQAFNCIPYEFTQKLDHFNATDNRTFQQLYYICDGAWPKDLSAQKSAGLIFFLGNEGPLTPPQQPIIFENAHRLKALVVELEHRYYGTSIPFTSNITELTTGQYKWLTVEQVLADSVAVIRSVRSLLSVPRFVPAVVIGGSYGGVLAAFHRLQRPDDFGAAVASSAPYLWMVGSNTWKETSENMHTQVAKAMDVMSGSKRCTANIRSAFDLLHRLGNSQSGRAQIMADIGLCRGANTSALSTAKQVFAMVNHLYDNFVGAVQLQGQPGYGSVATALTNACTNMSQSLADGVPQLRALALACTVIAGGPDYQCIEAIYPPLYIDVNLKAYSYQVCTQLFPMSSEQPSSGKAGTAIFKYAMSMETLRQECESLFGADLPPPKLPHALSDKVVGSKLKTVGGVVFTNGHLDEWAGGSINTPQRKLPKIKVVVYPNASHCTDTHNVNWDNPTEPSSLKALRAKAINMAVSLAKRR